MQNSDKKNSLNDFKFLCGSSLGNCFSKKVNRSTSHVTLLWKKQSPNIGNIQKLGNFRNFERWMRQYSDRKKSLNDFKFLCGSSLNNCFSKKVKRSTNHGTLLWKKQSPHVQHFQISVCRSVQKVGSFWSFGRWMRHAYG